MIPTSINTNHVIVGLLITMTFVTQIVRTHCNIEVAQRMTQLINQSPALATDPEVAQPMMRPIELLVVLVMSLSLL